MKQALSKIGMISIALLIMGCTRSYKTLESTADEQFSNSVHYQQINSKGTEAKRMMNKKVQAAFVSSSVNYAVLQVAESLDIDVDKTFIPVSDYRVTMNFKGTFGEFLANIYNETGIQYKYRHGILSVFNKNEVERKYKTVPCGKGSTRIEIALDGVTASEVFKHMGKNYNLNFVFNTKYYNLRGEKESTKKPLPKTSLFYKGCDKMAALRSFIRANDLRMVIKGGRDVEIYDYETAEIDIPTYYNVEFTGGQSSIGGSGVGSSGGSSSSGQSSGAVLSASENMKEDFKLYLQERLSPVGKAYISNRGYITIIDKPSSVREIKKLLRTEKRRQTPIELSVSVIRIDLNDELGVGVDWNKALSSIAQKYGLDLLTMGLSYSDRVGGGVSLSATKNGLTNIVKGLQKYGEARIDRNFNQRTRSGLLSAFKAVDEIPYAKSTVAPGTITSQVAVEPLTVEAGMIINIIPTLSDKQEIINLAINIELSQYQGDKILSVSGSTLQVPQITRNTLSMAARMNMGETIILTGLKVKEGTRSKEGIPGLSQAPTTLGGLFGYNQQTKKVSESLVVITATPVREY